MGSARHRGSPAQSAVARHIVLIVHLAPAEDLVMKLPERHWVIVGKDLVGMPDQLFGAL